MDGRDIGTVVLPDAEVKIFLVASVETRAQRRFLENKQRGIECNLRELKQEIVERDYQDTHRKHSPLRKAKDAIEIDTSNMNIDEVLDAVLNIVRPRL
jgi:cytidylate kinase